VGKGLLFASFALGGMDSPGHSDVCHNEQKPCTGKHAAFFV